MNEMHLQFLSSPQWARMLETDLLPWLDEVVVLGDDVLEIGPGPGLTTDYLRLRTNHLTAVEIDPTLAASLRTRFAGSNVDVVHADATKLEFPNDRFTNATCFSMLHHVPSPDLQDRIFCEVNRVLRRGGNFVGVDSLDIAPIRAGHVDDIFVPIGPGTLKDRLEAASFTEVELDIGDYQMRFHAKKR
ncbi:MAG: class I SAM-dependent methyltransferase [Actinomycetota bacterium]